MYAYVWSHHVNVRVVYSSSSCDALAAMTKEAKTPHTHSPTHSHTCSHCHHICYASVNICVCVCGSDGRIDEKKDDNNYDYEVPVTVTVTIIVMTMMMMATTADCRFCLQWHSKRKTGLKNQKGEEQLKARSKAG